jgi:hypothetical protein
VTKRTSIALEAPALLPIKTNAAAAARWRTSLEALLVLLSIDMLLILIVTWARNFTEFTVHDDIACQMSKPLMLLRLRHCFGRFHFE